MQPHGHLAAPLEKLRLSRKKKVLHADEQDSPETQEKRRAFCEELAGVDPHRLVFVDESGANTAMTRTYGRAPVGERVYAQRPGPLGYDDADLRVAVVRSDRGAGL